MLKLDRRMKEDIAYWIRQDNPTVATEEIGDIAYQFNRVLKVDSFHRAVVYRQGEHAILLDSQVDGHEWVIKIETFLCYLHGTTAL